MGSAFLGDGNNTGRLIQAGQGELKVMKMKSFLCCCCCFPNACCCWNESLWSSRAQTDLFVLTALWDSLRCPAQPGKQTQLGVTLVWVSPKGFVHHCGRLW